MKKVFKLAAMAAILILCLENSLPAGDYPTKPVTLIVPNPAGGSADVQARAFASVAEKFLGQRVLVVNKAGASGQIGLLACVQAPLDGHTLTISNTNFLLPIEWEIVNGRKPLVTVGDFASVGALSRTRLMITVPYKSPWKTLADLINDARANPGKYIFGSNSLYGLTHLATEIFTADAGLKFRHVPYTGGGPVASALVGSHVHFAVTTAGSTIPLVRSNKLRYLAVLGSERYEPIADIPSTKELGINAEFFHAWLGIWAPQKTPLPVVAKLRDLLKRVTEDKSFGNMLEGLGEEVHHTDGEELSKLVDNDLTLVRKLYARLIMEEKK
jgi:tripartite-type tricarboxylate transporter receptor subunit TctC